MGGSPPTEVDVMNDTVAGGGIAVARFGTLLARGCVVAGLAHTGFIGLFLALDVPGMVAVNVGSIGLYLLCLWLLRRGHVDLALLLGSLEVLGHAALAVRAVGWESGFHYFILILVPLGAFHPRWRPATKLAYVLLMCAAYLATALPDFAVPSGVDARLVSWVGKLNIAVTFLMLGYLAYYYNAFVDAAEAQLGRLATTDPLTGLLNRRRAMDIVAYEMTRASREARPLTVILADIDGFKTINDRHGHDTGDTVLVAVAHRLRGMVRAQDSVARWGGEEFLLLLPSTEPAGALQLAEKIRAAVERLEVQAKGGRVRLSMTLGVSELRAGESFEAALARADGALLRGKRSGRNRVEADASLFTEV